jgi:hypothetical protein
MITALSLNDYTGAAVNLMPNDKVLVTDVDGLFGIESPREVKRPRPTGSGAINDTRYGDGRLVSVAWDVAGTDQGDTATQFRTLTAPMVQTWDYGAALFKWTEATSGLTLQRLVKLDSDVTPHIAAGDDKRLVFQAQFFAEDPRAYSQTLTTVTGATLSAASGGLVFAAPFNWKFTPSGGGTAACTNAGNRKTPPVIRIYGYAVNPQVLNVTTGDRISVTGTIAAGDYLELDVYNRTAKLNGTTLRNNLIDSANTVWWELPAGASNVRLLAGTFDGVARADVLFRSAFA